MHVEKIVAQVLNPCLVMLHAKRIKALLRTVCALLMGGRLSLSALALSLKGSALYKHRIKSVDRLLGNKAMHAARLRLYAALAMRWLKGAEKILVVVDWSPLSTDQHWHLLRASVALKGRSVTLYEEVHPQSRYGHPTVHRMFLSRLAHVLPEGCRPILMTDAGFHASWFKLVAKRGWVYLGRLRGRDMVRQAGGQWTSIKALYAVAQSTVLDLGHCQYVRSNPIEVRLVLSRRPAHGRHQLNLYGHKRAARHSSNNARSAKEPWLLAASPRLDQLSAKALIHLYEQRMQIEQSFRDTKNPRVGFGMQYARSRTKERWQMLLLIAHLGAFVQRLVGEVVAKTQMELNFMASRHRARREISSMTLGRRVLDASTRCLDRLAPWAAIPILQSLATNLFRLSEP